MKDGTNIYPNIPRLIDVIVLRSEDTINVFARNVRGIHVPASTLTFEQQKAAYDRHHGKY